MNRQVVIQGGANRKERPFGKADTTARYDQVTAERLYPRQQFPASVVHGFRRRCETVVDAPVDIEVATGTDQQAARFPAAIHRGPASVRVEAGVTVAGQVEIALHHQIAVSGFADDFHPWAQMKRIGIGRIVEAGQFAL